MPWMTDPDGVAHYVESDARKGDVPLVIAHPRVHVGGDWRTGETEALTRCSICEGLIAARVAEAFGQPQ
jgi:hypothetical protein